MKKLTTFLLTALCMAVIFSACKKDTKEIEESEVSEAALAKIKALGFDTREVQKLPEGYLVEGDIVLTEAQLNSTPSSVNMIIAQEEQYHTFNLVKSTPRVLTVSVDGSISKAFSDAVDHAIGRYNAENLQLKFQRASTGGNIVIRLVNTGQYIASAGLQDFLQAAAILIAK
jgi:hypothetical protein